MTRKTVLIDLSDLNNPTCGFGQIAINYAKHFSALRLPDIRFVFLLPEGCTLQFPEHVECHYVRRKKKNTYRNLPHVDLWHSVNQNQLYNNAGSSTPLLLTIHDLNFLREKGWLSQLKHLFRLKRQIRHAHTLTAISQFVANEIQSHFNLGRRELKVIYDAVERIDQKPQAQPAFASPHQPFFFTIGQIRWKKNFHLLLDVMKHFPDHNLYICGDDHFDAGQHIRQRIADEHLSNVLLTGKVTDAERIWLYAHCHAFLFPSQGEGFGLPVIEAMQFGRAVFVAPFTCLPEIAGGHAFVWNDIKTDTMAEGIRTHLTDFYQHPEHIQAMKDYAQSFSYDHHVEQYIELYRKILAL